MLSLLLPALLPSFLESAFANPCPSTDTLHQPLLCLRHISVFSNLTFMMKISEHSWVLRSTFFALPCVLSVRRALPQALSGLCAKNEPFLYVRWNPETDEMYIIQEKTKNKIQ